MKKPFIIASSLLLTLFAVFVVLNVIFKIQRSPSSENSERLSAFDDLQQYIIVTNRKTTYQGKDIPEGSYYVVYKNIPDLLEMRERTRPIDIMSVNFVGSTTTLDLSNYLNQPLYLKTSQAQGKILNLNPELADFSFFTETRKVLVIEDIALVNE